MSLIPFAPVALARQAGEGQGLWDTTKAETTPRNVPNAGKRMSASRSRSSLRTRLRLAKERTRGNNRRCDLSFLVAHLRLIAAFLDQRNCDRAVGESFNTSVALLYLTSNTSPLDTSFQRSSKLLTFELVICPRLGTGIIVRSVKSRRFAFQPACSSTAQD